MANSRIETLKYLLQPEEGIDFADPPPIEFEQNDFSGRLEAGLLIIRPKIAFPTEVAARKHIEPFLRSWELAVALDRGHPEFSFDYVSATVTETDPPLPNGAQVILEKLEGHVLAGAEVYVKVQRGQYPPPPPDFRVSPDVETMWHRYAGYLRGQEQLTSMAYFCLNLLEVLAGSRKNAARLFQIEFAVLDKLGELTSTRGDATTARKAGISSPLTGLEINWITAAVRALIRRVGEHQGSASLAVLRLADLPAL